ncbi:hypothetical protein P8452_51165 [Trifolium repens]|nr:hypothetical protein P8452_51165 [Trifolium repens]
MYMYTILIDELCKVGRLVDAHKVFEDLLVKGYNLNVYTYTIMIHEFCNKGLFDEALTMLSKMEDNSCIPNAATYEIIIRSLFDKGENDKEEKLLREIIARGILPVSFFEGHALISVRWNIVKHFYSESKNCSSGSESEDEHELEEEPRNPLVGSSSTAASSSATINQQLGKNKKFLQLPQSWYYSRLEN